MTPVQEAFEVWAKEKGYALERLPSGDYYSTTTICAWFGWQGAHARIKEALEDLTRYDMGTYTFYDDSIETIMEVGWGQYVLRDDVKDLVKENEDAE